MVQILTNINKIVHFVIIQNIINGTKLTYGKSNSTQTLLIKGVKVICI